MSCCSDSLSLTPCKESNTTAVKYPFLPETAGDYYPLTLFLLDVFNVVMTKINTLLLILDIYFNKKVFILVITTLKTIK